MVHIASLTGATASVGNAHGAVSVMTGSVGTTVDSLRLKGESELDRNMTGKLDWIRATFESAASEATEQSEITVRAADFGTTKIGNAETDGAHTVRSAGA